MRTYQIKNALEGLSGKKLTLTGSGLLAVLVGASWSIVGHLASGDLSFLVFILVTGVIYGVYFLWTGRAALAIAFHFAWDLTLSSIFQLGSTSEASLYYVRISGIPDFPFEMSSYPGDSCQSDWFPAGAVVGSQSGRKNPSKTKSGLSDPDLNNPDSVELSA